MQGLAALQAQRMVGPPSYRVCSRQDEHVCYSDPLAIPSRSARRPGGSAAFRPVHEEPAAVTTLLLILLLTPFISAPLLLALGRRWGARVGWAALLAPLLSLGACLALYLLPEAQRTTIGWEWVPRLGVQLSFTPDGLALFFGLLVTGIGGLVTFYAACYLDDHYERHGQFYCFLQLFMGAMLVTVFSSNLLVLFTAWELTGITSFFLIGFLHDQPESRRGARMALLTTGFTGLALLVGIVLLEQVFGTLELPRMLAAPVPPGSEGLLTAAFLLCFVGICGKSALFPFQYWLPNAMAAPTPVSAYLHSATMVKLGVFLTARLLPVFVGLESWTPVLITIGFLTFLLGAGLAWLSYDLKAVLAFTTVAQLGMLVGQYGWASQAGPGFGDFLHILNHTLYKACLFMVVGVIDHSTGTRDLRQLGGLFKKMPLTGATALVGLAAMAGLPLTSGFISKELLLESGLAFQSGHPASLGLWPLLCTAGGSVLHALIALRVAKHVFFGATPDKVDAHFHAPSLGVQLPALLLALGVLYFGVQPAAFGHFTASFGPPGLAAPDLALWHGWTPAALLSLGVFSTAGALFWLTERTRWTQRSVPRLLRFDQGFDRGVEAIPSFGQWLDRRLGFPRLSVYLFIVVAFIVTVVLAMLTQARESLAPLLERTEIRPASLEGWIRWAVVLLISAGALLAAALKRPIPQLFAVSLVGFGVAFYYVLYRAPDLALTQLLVEAATLLLILLVVLRFKRDKAERQPLAVVKPGSRLVRVGVSAGAGLLLGLCVLIFPNGEVERAGSFYLEHTVPLAKGANAVNTVVVDFRGFDTMLEITVLLIAALGCLGLLARASAAPPRDVSLPTTDLFPVPRDFILKAVAIGGFLPLNLFSLYIFLRGHNAPGGGFVAGLITALSLLLLSFVLGVEGFRRRFRMKPMLVAVTGIALALGAAMLPLCFGLSLLHHLHTTVGPLTLGTPMLFDAGVFLTVVGVTLKLMLPLMKSVHGLPAFVREEEGAFTALASEPIDIDPTRHMTEPPRSEP
ncbi:hydrogen gas-evolving membrane-bound hydrogenase subunit E [Sorangium sp. So ce315]|uniref:hydrogen gas-evolving membrane-bound hydrogenase subunit E n=1 Tax=Sorangium sp. So ce315 TaxID=3133299 RepID=UPI003F613D29